MDQQFETKQATEVASETPVEATPETTTSPSPKQSLLMPLFGVIGLVIVLGVGYFGYTTLRGDSVAIVNGTKITKAMVDENINLMMKSATLQGIDTSDPSILVEIEKQAVTNLVNNELLLGAARRSGVGENEAAVQSAYDTLVTEAGGEDALTERMTTVGLTHETLMNNIHDRLMVDEYIEAETGIKSVTVNDDEVAAYIASINTEGVELPPLEEIRPQVKATLVAQKQQKIVDDLIAQLRAEGEIDVFESK